MKCSEDQRTRDCTASLVGRSKTDLIVYWVDQGRMDFAGYPVMKSMNGSVDQG